MTAQSQSHYSGFAVRSLAYQNHFQSIYIAKIVNEDSLEVAKKQLVMMFLLQYYKT